jgi:hypothetical protein
MTSFGTYTHVMRLLILTCTCTMGLTSRMYLARDVLRYVKGVGVVSTSHVNLYTWGLTSRMCFARDFLRYVIHRVGVARFMLTYILDGEACF